MNKIVVACDSFKGSLTSAEVASAVRAGIKEVFPECHVVESPVADGGEGTVAAITAGGGWREVETVVEGPLLSPVTARYAISGDGATALMEMASASGLTLIPENQRNPMLTTSYGTGRMIADAIWRGCRKVFIGLGGSATNDGGIGMLSALGWRFRDVSGRIIQPGGGEDLNRVSSIDTGHVPSEIKETEFIAAYDVDAILCGPQGASAVFAPQKGASKEDILILDTGMRHFYEIAAKTGIAMRDPETDIFSLRGAGAAGGLGAAMALFLGAKLMPGAEMVLDAIGFDKMLEGCDLVITGEGRMDSQTLMGKAPETILRRVLKHGIPVIGITGAVKDCRKLEDGGFSAIFPIQPGPISPEEAMVPDTARRNITRTVTSIMRSKRLSLS